MYSRYAKIRQDNVNIYPGLKNFYFAKVKKKLMDQHLGEYKKVATISATFVSFIKIFLEEVDNTF